MNGFRLLDWVSCRKRHAWSPVELQVRQERMVGPDDCTQTWRLSRMVEVRHPRWSNASQFSFTVPSISSMPLRYPGTSPSVVMHMIASVELSRLSPEICTAIWELCKSREAWPVVLFITAMGVTLPVILHWWPIPQASSGVVPTRCTTISISAAIIAWTASTCAVWSLPPWETVR